jgi:ABC-type transport system involved in cytochrome c biogenesis permease subunit
MAVATFIEKYRGTDYVAENIYGAWWFTVLWAMLTATAIVWFLRRRVKRLSTVVLHFSFVIILLGALITHLTSRQGIIHLRQGECTDSYMTRDMESHPLHFTVTLERFNINYHPGTQMPADYTSHLIIDGKKERVSMNHIASHGGFRLYQSGFDEDLHGTTLAVNSDPWGIPITYTGYALLFISLLWMLIDPHGTFRHLLRQTTAIVALMLSGGHAAAQPVLPTSTAERLGRLHIVYNDRLTPVETYALDFTKKICGSRSYKGLTAEQMLSGFLFWPEEWSAEPAIRVKGGALKETLQLPDHCSVNTFFNPTMGGYILGPYMSEYYNGNHDSFHKDAAKMDDRLMLIMQLRQDAPLTKMTRHIAEDARAGRFSRVDSMLTDLLTSQQASMPLPTPLQQRAEHLYNQVPFVTILFMANLTMGFLLFIALFIPQYKAFFSPFSALIALSSFLSLSLCLALRWIITGHIPMANGYETMLTMAWFVMLLPMTIRSRFPIAIPFGLLLSGFCLLVCHINQMDPQIGHLMPVLNSPLLSLHVSVIMMSFALLSITFLCGVTGLTFKTMSQQLHHLSLLMLYPAIATLGLGIFIGAIWANVSWGNYWSWDPKEVWALITLLVYAVPIHAASVPAFRRPGVFHLYMTLAFLTIMMTYFGVNYFLGGMHSYA